MEQPTTVELAREDTAHGEVALRRRGEVLELVVNGAFAMDTVDTTSEVALARRALATHGGPLRVLVGGLGLGFTARAVLADPRVERLDVVELAEPLVRWARAGLVPELAGLEQDGRCRLWAADVADVIARRTAPAGLWDLILLDVDNGPGFLVHEHNASLYAPAGLAAARDALEPGGVLVIWSSHRAPELLSSLERVGPERASETVLAVHRDGHHLDYALYALSRPPGGREA